jgi:hypothetical protein
VVPIFIGRGAPFSITCSATRRSWRGNFHVDASSEAQTHLHPGLDIQAA